MLGGVFIGEEPLPWSGPIFSHQISGERRETGQTPQCCLLPRNVKLPQCPNNFIFTVLQILMMECWDEDPGKRPSFSQLVSTISAMLEEMAGYLNLH